MLRKNYFIYLTVVALFLLSSVAVFAQVSPVRGKIELKKADGTTVPAAEAVIDVYRTDAKGKMPSGKTNKKGEFAFAGLPVGQRFMFVVSAPGVQAQIFPNLKAGDEGVLFTVYEGDGKRLTEEEARQLLTAPKKSSNNAGNTTNTTNTTNTANTTNKSDTPAATPEEIAAAKKAQAEYEAKKAEVESKNKKIEGINQIVDKAISEGKAAFDAKNYDLAIERYTEGVNADPEFIGTAPVFLNNRGTAYKLRGFDSYKKSTTDATNKASLMESAKKDFLASANDFQKSLALLKTANTTDPKLQKDYEANKRVALTGLVETRRLLIGTRADTTQNKEAVAALEEYAAMETDAAQKTKTMLLMADALRLAGDSANAVPIYKKILEISPEDPNVLGGLGLSLFDVGVSTTNKEQMQEGLNLMERFTQVAPETHPLKTDIKGAVEYLKTNEKLTAQPTKKSNAPAKKKN
jgi:tetratricopeptide (TPR) repeat protein